MCSQRQDVYAAVHVSFRAQVTELSETTRGSGGFGSTGVEQSTLQASAVENGAKKFKADVSEPVRVGARC